MPTGPPCSPLTNTVSVWCVKAYSRPNIAKPCLCSRELVNALMYCTQSELNRKKVKKKKLLQTVVLQECSVDSPQLGCGRCRAVWGGLKEIWGWGCLTRSDKQISLLRSDWLNIMLFWQASLPINLFSKFQRAFSQALPIALFLWFLLPPVSILPLPFHQFKQQSTGLNIYQQVAIAIQILFKSIDGTAFPKRKHTVHVYIWPSNSFVCSQTQ